MVCYRKFFTSGFAVKGQPHPPTSPKNRRHANAAPQARNTWASSPAASCSFSCQVGSHRHRGTQFRQWAIGRLNEYLVKGCARDDKRLKTPPGKGQKDYKPPQP